MANYAEIPLVVQVAPESTPGTPATTGFKRLQSMKINMGDAWKIQTFTPSGSYVPSQAIVSDTGTVGTYKGAPTFEEVAYPWASLGGVPTPTTAGTAYIWDWTFKLGALTSKAFTAEYGDPLTRVPGFQASFMQFIGWKFSLDRDGGTSEHSGNVLARYMTDWVTDGFLMKQMDSEGGAGGVVTALPATTIQPTYWSCYIDDASGSLGGTKFSDTYTIDFDTGDTKDTLTVIDAAYPSWKALLDTERAIKAKLQLSADAAGVGLRATAKNGAKKFIRMEAVGPTISGGTGQGTAYRYRIDFCGVITNADAWTPFKNALSIPWEFTAAYDATWDAFMRVRVVNKQATL